uniref:Fe2OG dioxygenase domain-containing protein n=1 Tax=Caenorhabditis tropicalis TaxID=1561998 RepID=A0A1I7TRE9_9PELO
MYEVYTFLLTAILLWCPANADVPDEIKNFKFEGDNFWVPEIRALCDDIEQDVTWQYEESVCITYIQQFQLVKVEVVSTNPGLVVYRDIFTKKQVDDYLLLLETKTLETQQVLTENGSEYYSNVRRANGTSVLQDEGPAAISIVRTVQAMIPTIDFKVAENIVALSYEVGGHYGIHHDYLEYDSEEDWDQYTKELGNRFGTLIMVFKTAEKGGATVFPALGSTVRSNAGDAFFWFNVLGNTNIDDYTEHGGCPIYAGNKIISTFWVRMNDQPILDKVMSPSSIAYEYLVPGKV